MSTQAARPKRPVSVTLVAVLALAVAVYSAAYGVLAVYSAAYGVLAVRGDPSSERLADGVFHLALGVGALAAGLGAFRMRPWGWAVFMTWAVIGLTHQILRYLFFGDPNYADMAINTFVVLALSPLDVQVAFGLRHTEKVQLGRPSRNPVDGE
jgi:cell division protein FtsW (lipid II flippase)